MGQRQDEFDRRFMAAAIRYSRWNLGRTAANPSVATLIVADDRGGPEIVGRAVTAIGGRPHAEPVAIAEAGERARGATAYVTLEPCAHHGRTPPCAEALISAGIVRVVGGASDPDPRVSGRGYAMLRKAGIDVVEGVLAEEAADAMAGYLMRSTKKRPEIIVKLAVSTDGMIGRKGEGQVTITGQVSRAQVHLMRAEADAIVVGIGTALADDPELTCRLPGLAGRSPARIVLDSEARLPVDSKLVRTVQAAPVLLAVGVEADPDRRAALEAAGVRMLAAESIGGAIALPELMEDVAAQGMSSVLVEGGAETAKSFLAEDLVDRIALFTSPVEIGGRGIAAPIDRHHVPPGFRVLRTARFGDDDYLELVRAR